MQGDGEDQDVIDNLKALQAIGVSQDIEGSYSTISVQVSVN
jgi:hypothetical protein